MIMGIKFSEQTPESFWQYSKDIAKHQGIKKPESAKPKLKKTRKKQTKNGKHDNSTGLEPSPKRTRKAKEDAGNIHDARWETVGCDQLLKPIGN